MPGPYDYSQGQWIDAGGGRGFLAPGGMYPQPEAPAPAVPEPVPSVVSSLGPDVYTNVGLAPPETAKQPEPVAPAPHADIPVAAPAPTPMPKAGRAPKQKAAQAQPVDKFQQADNIVTGALDTAGQAGADVAATQATAADAKYEEQRKAAVEADTIAAEQKRVAAEREKLRADKQAQVDRYVHDEDNFKIDENKFWGDASTAKNIGRVIAMAMTGLGMALQGRGHEQNPVIAMFDQGARRSVQMQMDQRDQLAKRSARAQQGLDSFDRITDAKDARFSADMARAYERGIRMGDLAASKYGGDLAKKNWQVQRAELEKQKGEYLGKAAEGAFGRDVQKQQLDISRKQVAISGGQLALANKQFAYSKERDEAEFALKVAELNKKGDADKAKLVAEKGIPGVFNKDGSPMLAQGSSPEDLAKIKDRVTATKSLVDILDRVRRIRTGWTSALGNSKEHQQLKSEWAAAQLEAKEYAKLGVLAGPDLELINNFLGAEDPTRWKDPTEGIKSARQRIIKSTNSYLQGRGLDGDFDIPDISSDKGAVITPGDERAKLILQDPGRLPSFTPHDAPGVSWSQKTEASWKEAGGVHPAQRQAMEQLAQGLTSPDPRTREFVYSSLANAAQNGKSQSLRDLAAQLISRGQTADMFASGTPEVGVTR